MRQFQRNRRQVQAVPGLSWYTCLQNTRNARRNPLPFLIEQMHAYGDIFRGPTVSGTYYFVTHPEGVKHVLQTNNRNYSRDTPIFHRVSYYMGKGLLTTDGPSWLGQRRLLQPAFHKRHLADFSTLVTAAALAQIERWDHKRTGAFSIDINHEMQRLTSHIIALTFFNSDLSEKAEEFIKANWDVENWVYTANFHPWLLLGFPTLLNRQFRAGCAMLKKLADEIIAAGHKHSEKSEDFLSILLHSYDGENGKELDHRQIRAQVITFLETGYASTASALSWAWYLLARHPKIEQRTREELDTVLGGRIPTFADIPQLSYTQMVLKEAMRLYPPAWILDRRARADDEIQGYHIPKGSIVNILPYLTHRHPAIWEQPEAFDPERFTPERSVQRPRYAYIPFGGGPHLCIGDSLALTEATLILATILPQLRFRLAPEVSIEPRPLVVLHPASPVQMTCQRL